MDRTLYLCERIQATHGCLADDTEVVLRDETKRSSVSEELCNLTKALHRASVIWALYPKEAFKSFL